VQGFADPRTAASASGTMNIMIMVVLVLVVLRIRHPFCVYSAYTVICFADKAVMTYSVGGCNGMDTRLVNGSIGSVRFGSVRLLRDDELEKLFYNTVLTALASSARDHSTLRYDMLCCRTIWTVRTAAADKR
jgi:hypothetical protein